ncbi:MAG: hypothetical protein ACJ75F_12095 [Flavisolibacter sp.]|jgi:hypothetical protein
MTKLYPLALFCIIILASCRTASKSYQKGDYTDAIERGVKKLQKDPYDYETRDLIQKSYNYSVTDHEDQVRILSNSKSENRFEKIYQEYAELQKLYNIIHEYPAVASMIKTTDYSDYVNTYRDKAADIHIEKADKWIEEGTKQAYREAYRELNVALRYRPDDFELKRKRDDVYESAVTNVIISPIQNYGRYNYNSSFRLENFQRDVIRTLTYNMNNEFVRFYNEYDARNSDIEADQIMELNLSRISIGQPYDNTSSRESSKEVVIKEIVYKPDSVVKQYGTVKARITTTKRTLLSQGDLFITVRDTKGRILWNDRFTGEHKWQTEFATYTGDERALTENDKTLLNQKQYNPPSEDHIMEELLSQIQNDLTYRLRNYYQRSF